MSLPMPHAGTGAFPANLTPQQQDALDAPLIALTSKSGGDLRKLLYMFFSFLHRRTDFYCVPNDLDMKEGVPIRMGFKEGDAEKLLLAAFRQFPLRRMPRQAGSGIGRGAASAPVKKAEATSGSASSASAVPPPTAGPRTETGNSKASPKRSAGKKPFPDGPMSDVRRTEEGKQIPVGNGGATERYRWTQTIDEATVVVALPEGTRGKDLDVSIKPGSVSVGIKGKADSPPILQGDLTERIRADESTWSLEGGALLLTLDKVKKTWWETVLVGDDKIDTSLVDSTRKIGSYDEATQGAIRKILFDQRQERMGLPTSDELLGKKPDIPPLPPGVEFIDKTTFENEKETPSTEHKKQNNSLFLAGNGFLLEMDPQYYGWEQISAQVHIV
eukprot:CAMPEP_0183308750 /NCGR_PEP_ID=MMETSP0160_2-20130417/22439_1 /TAXON_ID=2839 ORGANISM="Odontella Sinensis, Strain Grunow 1884" /NCGR_SAMPLE_ID=MMETSP0160_2 /ASSEMBLY_ACC=CAM_ASM_000250 /LENGTH=386 /DNA_ID=CAMNT_0025472637 /DNA_START=24 /DNA_END=1185 /DNA_ORIENTATION=-